MSPRTPTTQGFQGQNSRFMFSVQKPCPSHSRSAGLRVLQWSQGHPVLLYALGPCHAGPLLCRSLLSSSNTPKQVSIVYLLSGLLCPEPSAPRGHVDFTRTTTGMSRSLQHPGCPDVLFAITREARSLPRKNRAGASHSSRSSPMANCHTAGTYQQQKGHDSPDGGCSPGHISLCCPSDTLKVLAPRRRPCRREAACWAAAESV